MLLLFEISQKLLNFVDFLHFNKMYKDTLMNEGHECDTDPNYKKKSFDCKSF